ncbi:TetR/AcrR family transcriptional regulator [Arthrobacter sp. CAU 1506]|uniref:TetR/AcrR family transcriptional regulator n=1 Tax=Arthrobacter sp. CAU 1506 TaxID=2560052 RepID=UPI00145F9E7E|nr:TetR/AcrR family transcriptional regulator [Arthrobacter sp. CAU 1506]
MARPQNPQRKPQLLEDILDYLQDKNLADLSFRPLAEALGISSYMLVYHFGHREQLLEEIVHQVQAQLPAPSQEQLADLDAPALRQLLLQIWERSQTPQNRVLQRLGFEAAIQQAASRQAATQQAAILQAAIRQAASRPTGSSQSALAGTALRPPGFSLWRDAAAGWLRARGAGEQQAAAEGTLFAAGLCGLWFGQVVAAEPPEGSTEAFHLLLERLLQAAP